MSRQSNSGRSPRSVPLRVVNSKGPFLRTVLVHGANLTLSQMGLRGLPVVLVGRRFHRARLQNCLYGARRELPARPARFHFQGLRLGVLALCRFAESINIGEVLRPSSRDFRSHKVGAGNKKSREAAADRWCLQRASPMPHQNQRRRYRGERL